MKTKILSLSLLLGLPVLAVGCSDVNTGDYVYVTFDAAALLDGGTTLNPVPPFLGQQLDRVGRPGIERLLVNPFNLTPTVTYDAYNAVSDSTNGFPMFAANFALNLAAWDGINNPPTQAQGGQCGDQPLATAAPIVSSRYMALATALANDYLIVDSTQRTCAKFMAPELGIGGDCGGREPKFNAVDAVLNLLQGGSTTTNPATVQLTTGVSSDPDGTPVANFPFLLPPT